MTQIYSIVKKNLATLSQIANQEWHKVANWLGANKLSLNVNKTPKNKETSHNNEIHNNNKFCKNEAE